MVHASLRHTVNTALANSRATTSEILDRFDAHNYKKALQTLCGSFAKVVPLVGLVQLGGRHDELQFCTVILSIGIRALFRTEGS